MKSIILCAMIAALMFSAGGAEAAGRVTDIERGDGDAGLHQHEFVFVNETIGYMCSCRQFPGGGDRERPTVNPNPENPYNWLYSWIPSEMWAMFAMGGM